MPAPTPTQLPPLSLVQLVPSDNPRNGWLTYRLSGVPAPGSIPVGGVRGFRRKTGWDIKSGKGTAGATLTRKTAPPVKGSIVSQLFTDEDFAEWDAFCANVLYTPPGSTATDGLAIYYPQFAAIGLVAVVIEEYSGPEYVGKGMYHAMVELIEWSPPPAASIVATVATTGPDIPNANAPTKPQDPRITAAQSQLAAAEAAAAAANDAGGGGSEF